MSETVILCDISHPTKADITKLADRDCGEANQILHVLPFRECCQPMDFEPSQYVSSTPSANSEEHHLNRLQSILPAEASSKSLSLPKPPPKQRKQWAKHAMPALKLSKPQRKLHLKMS